MGRLLLLLLLAAGGVLAWLLGTTSGARMVIDLAQQQEPRLRITVETGTLWHGLDLTAVGWRDGDLRIEVDHVESRWELHCLWRTKLCLDRLHLQGIRIQLPAADNAESTPKPFRYRPPTLPEIALPLDIELRAFRLRQGQLRIGDDPILLPEMEVVATLRGGRLRLSHLELRHPYGRLRAQGQLALTEAWTTDLQMEVEGGAALTELLPSPLSDAPRLQARLSGPLQARLQLDMQLRAGPQAIDLGGWLAPMQSDLPFHLTAEWPQLSWPPEAAERYQAHDGRLTLSGSLAAWKAGLESRLAAPDLPSATLKLRADGDLEHARLERATLRLLEGEAHLHGTVAWRDNFTWEGRLTLASLAPDRFWPRAPEQLNGQITGSGVRSAEETTLSLALTEITARLQGQPVTLDGQLELASDGRWNLQALRLQTVEGGSVHASGTLHDTWDLSGKIELPELSALGVPELGGSLQGRLRLHGARSEPDLDAEITAHRLRAPAGITLEQMKLTAQLPALGRKAGGLQMTLQELTAGPERLERADLQIRGNEAAHTVTLRGSGPRTRAIDVALEGGWDRTQDAWRGTLTKAELAIPRYGHHLTLESPLGIAWRGEEALLHLADHCWQVNTASTLCFELPGPVGRRGVVHYRLRDYDAERGVRPWLPEAIRLETKLSADGTLQWGERIRATMALHGDAGTVHLRMNDAEPAEAEWEPLHYRTLTTRLDYSEEAVRLALTLDSQQLGDLQLSLTTDPRPGDRPLDGRLLLTGFKLPVVRPFLPELSHLEGEFSTSLQIGGHWQAPALKGELALRGGMVDGATLPTRLHDIQLDVGIDGNRADYEGRFRAREGAGRLHGQMIWSDRSEWRLHANLTGEDLAIFLPPGLDLILSADLQSVIQPGEIRLRGRVDIPRGRIDIQELPEQAVGLSRDVVIVRPKPETAVEPPPPGRAWKLDIALESSVGEERLQLSAFGLTGLLKGGVNLRLREDIPEGVGEIRVVDGRYRAYGQNLRIRRGTLLFAGPLEQPQLDIEAVRELPRYDVVAGLRVQGRADDPRLTLFSEPAMPDEEALSYLIRGRPLSAEGEDSGALMAAAALSLGVTGAQGLLGEVGERLGIEEVEVEAVGEGEETQVVVGGYLNPRLYLSYGVGVFLPENTLTLRYQLTRQLFLEAVSGVENALDLFYRFEFGDRGPAPED